MKIKPNTPLKTFNNEQMKSEGKPVLLRNILINCLMMSDNQNLGLKSTPEQKLRAYELGVEITNKEEVDLKAEDITFIKERLGKLYNPLVYGQIVEILEK